MLRVASSDGVTLAVHDLGGDGPPVLLCHATGFHGLVWAPLARFLADGYRVWSLDFRGHGLSTSPAGGDFVWQGFADDVLATLDALAPQLGGEAPFGVGHSMGGVALLLAEAAHPGTFAALACYEPIVFPPSEGPARDNPLAAGALRRRDVFASRDEAFANFAAKPPLSALAPEALRAYVDHGFEDRPDGTVRLRCRPEHESAVYTAASQHPGWRRLAEVACPTTVLAGEHSDAIDPGVAGAQVARLPAGRLQVANGLGHFGPLDDPGAFAGALETALGSS
ncbi:MAG: alpha/beta hydrolase [Acidimicrobiia bacterium]|nr:alpha/beta hydrolase [Acidimicrobiia bacterium]